MKTKKTTHRPAINHIANTQTQVYKIPLNTMRWFYLYKSINNTKWIWEGWHAVLDSQQLHRVHCVYHPGHARGSENEQADRLASRADITGLQLGRAEVLGQMCFGAWGALWARTGQSTKCPEEMEYRQKVKVNPLKQGRNNLCLTTPTLGHFLKGCTSFVTSCRMTLWCSLETEKYFLNIKKECWYGVEWLYDAR